MRRLLVTTVGLLAGCQTFGDGAGSDPLATTAVSGEVVAPLFVAPPVVVAEPSCEPVYIAPGEPCYGPANVAPGDDLFAAPTAPLSPAVDAADAGPLSPAWHDVLPTDGGPISTDFGLPAAPVVENRIPNPLTVPVTDPEFTWDALADVVSDYFPISREERVMQVGALMTEGRIETPYQTGATLLEPWRRDSVGAFNRWQSTLQSIRRRAVVRVIPAGNAYQVAVQVDKELEDLPRPERATAGAAVLRNDSSLPVDRLNRIDGIRPSNRWLGIGRDEPLEQAILQDIRERLTPAPPGMERG